MYAVLAWVQGDYSCNCRGFVNYRHCNHTDKVIANPEKYKKQQGSQVVNAGAGSISGTIEDLKAEMDSMEAAIKRGDAVEIEKIRAKIEYHRALFAAAGEGLGNRFEQVTANIKAHLMDEKPKKAIERKEPDTVAADTNDPFADM